MSPEALGLPRAVVFVDVQRALAVELLLDLRRHRVIGLVHVREHGVAAGRRQLERIEERVLVGLRRIAGIDVKPEVALAEGADRNAVLLDVADQQNLLVILLRAFGAGAQFLRRLLARAEIAEIGRELELLVLRDGLAAEHQHQMLVPGVPDRLHGLARQRLGEIDALDLRAAGGRQRHDLRCRGRLA